MNSFVGDVFEQLATEAGKLVSFAKKQTLDARAVQTAARLVLSGELSNHVGVPYHNV